jgi:hypothetical protein
VAEGLGGAGWDFEGVLGHQGSEVVMILSAALMCTVDHGLDGGLPPRDCWHRGIYEPKSKYYYTFGAIGGFRLQFRVLYIRFIWLSCRVL